MSDEKENLIGTRVRFRPDFYTTRIIPTRGWTGTIEEERRSSSGQGSTWYIVLLDEPFRSQEQDPRVDATEDEMEPFGMPRTEAQPWSSTTMARNVSVCRQQNSTWKDCEKESSN